MQKKSRADDALTHGAANRNQGTHDERRGCDALIHINLNIYCYVQFKKRRTPPQHIPRADTGRQVNRAAAINFD